MWAYVIGGGVISFCTTWAAVVGHRCRERSVDRLATAREKGVNFDLPAAIERLHPPPRRRVVSDLASLLFTPRRPSD